MFCYGGNVGKDDPHLQELVLILAPSLTSLLALSFLTNAYAYSYFNDVCQYD